MATIGGWIMNHPCNGSIMYNKCTHTHITSSDMCGQPAVHWVVRSKYYGLEGSHVLASCEHHKITPWDNQWREIPYEDLQVLYVMET